MLLLRYFVQGRLGRVSLKHLRLLKPSHFVFLLGASYFVFVGYGALHSTGQVGSTKKNGDGCTCHGDHVSTDTVLVWVEGPDTVVLGDAAVYTMFIKGGPAIGGGFNVATSTGTLSAFDGTSQIVSGELTHTAPKSFANDSVAWRFFYQAPASGQTDTIFSVGNSVDLNGIPSGDQYNFGTNFIVHLKDTTTGVEDEYQPLSFHLYQNYPNPFNPVTSIQYSVVSTQYVSVKVFDIVGNEVATLVQGATPAGKYEVEFNASNFPSGIYFYTLSVGSNSISKKMLLIR